MEISEFKKRLSKAGVSSGGQFRKVDFHVHLPGSSDYEYKGADAIEKMANALTNSDIAVAVVLKHQEFPTRKELETLQNLCPATTLIRDIVNSCG